MKFISGIVLGLVLGVSIAWIAGVYEENRRSQEPDRLTSRFPEIKAYIADTVPRLRKYGAHQVEMEPVPYEGGGAVLLRGSVRNTDEFYILHTMLENWLTNPDLPARFVWKIGLADTHQHDTAKTR